MFNKLNELFSTVPLERVTAHPAEAFLAENIDRLEDIERIILSETVVSAGTLVCLARVDGVPLYFLRRLVERCLRSCYNNIREAAMYVIETRPEVGLDILRNHNEPDKWLSEYQAGILINADSPS